MLLIAQYFVILESMKVKYNGMKTSKGQGTLPKNFSQKHYGAQNNRKRQKPMHPASQSKSDYTID